MTDFEKKENEVTEDELSAEEVNVFGNCGDRPGNLLCIWLV